ncbi:MAG: plastocyanin/azurin family copper-binding protein [Actinomycetota bacterium]|nr:plastocyanin/azurin family copper-binding protein [Actinomycetota bacterium]
MGSAVLLALLALLTPPLADASNRRIAISDYRWSDPEIEIDLGEHVTWYWTGPDLMHSVTGESANAKALDSDPGTNQPIHDLGDEFQLSFDQPGAYVLQCKLHSTVKGQVTVSATPGDPLTEPDPVPRTQVDLKAPRLRDLRLGDGRFGRRGTSLRFSLGERAKVAAELFRFDRHGRRGFAGYQTWKGFVGYNGVRIGSPGRHFRPRPGRYLALLTATDQGNNTSPARRLRFTIRSR